MVKSVPAGQIEVSSQDKVSYNHHLTIVNKNGIKLTHKNIFNKKEIHSVSMYIANILCKIHDCVKIDS